MSRRNERKETFRRAYFNYGLGWNYSSLQVESRLFSDFFKPGCSHVRHWTSQDPFTGPSGAANGTLLRNYCVNAELAYMAYQLCFDAAFRALQSGSQSDSNLIEFLSEIDKIPQLFHARTYASYSGYGAYTWGLRPFLKEIKSFSAALKSLLTPVGNGLRIPVSIRSREPNLYEIKPNLDNLTGERSFFGTYNINGYITIESRELSYFMNALALWADQLGFNPDASTAWDLVPFSFVVDYYVPIGDILERLHPRGWSRFPVTFTGSISIKGVWTATEGHPDIPSSPSNVSGRGLYYQRQYYADEPVSLGSKLSSVKWDLPSVKNGFDSAYVYSLARNKFKNKFDDIDLSISLPKSVPNAYDRKVVQLKSKLRS